MREFETGATRDQNKHKPDYRGFNSPLVEKRFGEYMLKHQVQADGSLRASTNWKLGIPIDAYIESLHRHYLDLWLHLDGFPEEAVDPDIESVLCAIRFNTNGMLHELLKKKKASPAEAKETSLTNAEIIKTEFGVGVKWGPLQGAQPAQAQSPQSSSGESL